MIAQVRIVSALCVLHNILVNLREADLEADDVDEADLEEDGEELSESERSGRGYHVSRGEQTRAAVKRDEVATAMWTEYLTRRATRDSTRDRRERSIDYVF